jgi:DAACS family dicarboxylate/amino acid:cation (Na+ or H+) symporter
VLIGFLLGGAGGVLANLAWHDRPGLDGILRNLADPIGQIFLRLLLMVVIPLVFATVTTGMVTLGSLRDTGRLGIRTLAFYLGLAVLGAVIGLSLGLAIGPSEGLSAALRARLPLDGPGEATPIGIEALLRLVPTNVVDAAARGDLLPILVFTLLFGAALASLPPRTANPLRQFLEGLAAASSAMVALAMRVAPLGVAGLAFASFARFGWQLLAPLGLLVATVTIGLAVLLFVVFPLLLRIRPKNSSASFLKESRPALITAFATASSNATLPTTLRVAEALGTPPAVRGFVIPLGATLSRAGTATFTAATAVFLAQVLGIGITGSSAVAVVALATVTAIAAGGVPSGVVPLLATVVAGAGVPASAIGLVLGIEPILGMARTAVNVGGALVAGITLTENPSDR